MDKLLEVRVEPARDSGEKGPDDEGEHLVFRGIDAHCFGGDFVVAHGEKTAAVRGVNEVEHDVHGERGEGEGPKEIRVLNHSSESSLGAERFGILDDTFDDFIEAKGDDGEVVAAQAQRGNSHRETCERRHQSSRNQREERTWSSFARAPNPKMYPKLKVSHADE